MIKTYQHAVDVQKRRLAAGKKGRSKAVRRWFKREFWNSRERPEWWDVWHDLAADFDGCRTFNETYNV